MSPRISSHILLVFVVLGSIAPRDSDAQQPAESLASEIPTIEAVVVAPYTPLRETRNAFRQRARFDAIPESERSHVAHGFYLFNEATARVVAAGPSTPIIVRAISSDGVRTLETSADGQIHLPPDHGTVGTIMEVNARGRYALRSRPGIDFPMDAPPTLAWVDQAINQYFEIYKRIYASRLFRMFVGDRRANCVSFLFVEPSTVSVRSVTGAELWRSPADRVVTVFRSDLDSIDPDAVLDASSQPARVGACLQNRDN